MAYALQAGLWVSLSSGNTTASYTSGGATGSNTVIISSPNSNINYGQALTGSGFAPNTFVTGVSGTTITFSPVASSQVSGTLTFTSVWYKLTDHNRSPINITPQTIQKESRMANGKLRKYVVDSKDTISTSWEFLPAKPSEIVDGNYGAAWISEFYNANVGVPIWLKVVNAKDSSVNPGQYPKDSTFVSSSTGEKIYHVFMTNFSKVIRKRTPISDYLDMNIEFVEI